MYTSDDVLSLPLFLYFDDSIVTYVIENRLLVCTDMINFEEQNPFKAFEILRVLFSTDKSKKHLPSQFYHFFNKEDYIRDSTLERCLIGEDYTPEFGKSVLCVRLDAELKTSQDMKVLLHNIIYDTKPLNQNVILSIEEAFLIFANLCTNAFKNNYYTQLKQSNRRVFDRSIIKQYDDDSPLKIINNFCIDYLDYLKKLLVEGSLAPKNLLRTCGIGALHLFSEIQPVNDFILSMLTELQYPESLPLTLKIAYFTLLKSFHSDSSIYSIIDDFGKKNRTLIKILRDEIVTPLPNHEH
ncbi:MAG: hypothetical protein KGD64_09180 [Candidatus Heimdallarchaeota archaeon]|nr:hypothetical protein [Candidatus Heimdallarchaeota archaeon]